MPGDLYAQDIVVWSERQSALLRRLASGERVNDLDWPHIIEEIEDVGGSAVRAVRSLLARAIEHLLKLHGWPGLSASEHWRREVRAFLGDARREFTPGMRQQIDVDAIYADAAEQIAADTMGGQPPAPLPGISPWTLDELLARPANVDALLAIMSGPAGSSADA
jgi:hypothetical protein